MAHVKESHGKPALRPFPWASFVDGAFAQVRRGCGPIRVRMCLEAAVAMAAAIALGVIISAIG
jgi:hypothetical protein